MKFRSVVHTAAVLFLCALGVAIFLMNRIEVREEHVGAHYSSMKKESKESCPQLDGGDSDLENIKRMYESMAFECLSYRLSTMDPTKFRLNVVRYLNDVLDAEVSKGWAEFQASGVADVAAYIVSIWAWRCHEDGQNVVFNFELHKAWLIDRVKSGYSEYAELSYAVDMLIRYGSYDDMAVVEDKFRTLNTSAQMSAFVALSLRCDEDSRRRLQQIKQKNPTRWKSHQDLNLRLECHRC